PDSAIHIRLLRVFRINKSSTEPNVRCQLTTWPEDSAPSYYAISYTWGDPLLRTDILVNGKRMRVRQNCEYVLKQAFWQGGSRYHWVDAICINQDDLEEKAEQVARMATIFSKALRVLACVGKHADGSKSFFRFVRKHAESFSRHAQSHTDQDYIGEGLTWWLLFFRPWKIPSLSKRLQVFLQRGYFTRLWVFQELFHARAV
ncbi:heterokaryon incompatibility protein-domain-containing protein, partial [Ilyonectria sp. MPI-CAGE-AT-0026]